MRVIRKISNKMKTLNDKEIKKHKLMFIFDRLFLGVGSDDWKAFKFKDRSRQNKNTIITAKKNEKLIKKFNNSNEKHLLNDKKDFIKHFHSLILRTTFHCENFDNQMSLSHLNDNDELFVKPIDGLQGRGIFKINKKEFLTMKLEDYQNFIFEQKINQHDKLALINESSVNTIRIITVKNNNKVKIISTSIRMGRTGSIVDNAAQGGIYAGVNIENGIIDTYAFDNDNQMYFKHPDSKVILLGFQLPRWEEVKELAIKAHMKLEKLQYIGWDIAITNDGVDLIEGNLNPDIYITQVDQIGRYKIIRDFLKQKRK